MNPEPQLHPAADINPPDYLRQQLEAAITELCAAPSQTARSIAARRLKDAVRNLTKYRLLNRT